MPLPRVKPWHLILGLAAVAGLSGCNANPDSFNGALQYGVVCTESACSARGGTAFCYQKGKVCQPSSTYPCYRCVTSAASSSRSSSLSSSSVSSGSSLSGSGSSLSSPSAGSGGLLCPGNAVCSKEASDDFMRCFYVPIVCPEGSRRMCEGSCGSSTCHGVCCFCVSS